LAVVVTLLTVRVCELSLAGPVESLVVRLATAKFSVVSSSVLFESSPAVGASLTSVTVMLTVEVLESFVPSLTLKVKLSGPE